MFNIFRKKIKIKKLIILLDRRTCGFMQRIAMKKLEKMSPEEKRQTYKKVMTQKYPEKQG